MAALLRASAYTGGLVGIEVPASIDDGSSNGGDACKAERPFAGDAETFLARTWGSTKTAVLRVLWEISSRNDVVQLSNAIGAYEPTSSADELWYLALGMPAKQASELSFALVHMMPTNVELCGAPPHAA